MGEERTPRFDDAAYDATSGIAIGAITVAITVAIDLARCQCAEGSERHLSGKRRNLLV